MVKKVNALKARQNLGQLLETNGVSFGIVESTVHEVVSKRFCKKQQMQWSKLGAYLLLQTRVDTRRGVRCYLQALVSGYGH
jgi:hypothetical protein